MNKIVTLTLSTLASAAIAAGQTTIITAVPYQLNKPKTYILLANLISHVGQPAITIGVGTGNVILDFRGHSITSNWK